MKSFLKLAAICASLTATISAVPTSGLIGIIIKNEFNGKTAMASLRADGRFNRFPDLFANTPLDENGQFFGTSAQLVQPNANTKCTIRSSFGDLMLNNSEPVIDLDGNRNVALLKPLVLNGFEIQCEM
jgi:hypothetical protein